MLNLYFYFTPAKSASPRFHQFQTEIVHVFTQIVQVQYDSFLAFSEFLLPACEADPPSGTAWVHSSVIAFVTVPLAYNIPWPEGVSGCFQQWSSKFITFHHIHVYS